MRSILTSLIFLLTAGSAFAADPGNTVPEPGTMALVGLAAAVAFALRKRK